MPGPQRRVTERHIADAYDRLSVKLGRKPSQAEVASDLRTSRRIVGERWPFRGPDPVEVIRALPDGGVAGGVYLSHIVGTLRDPSGRGVDLELPTGLALGQAVELDAIRRLRSEGKGTRRVAHELGLDRSYVRRLLGE